MAHQNGLMLLFLLSQVSEMFDPSSDMGSGHSLIKLTNRERGNCKCFLKRQSQIYRAITSDKI